MVICMCYTLTMKPTRLEQLGHLDELLLALRTVTEGREYRRRMLAVLPPDVTPGILRVLRVVERLGRSASLPTVNDIASTLLIEQSTASRAVTAAERVGLVQKSRDPDDCRRFRLNLTLRGVAVLDDASNRRRELVGEATGDWPDKTLDQLVEDLTRLKRGFDRFEGSS